ncbi:MAG: hypothetical protein U0Z17_05635 [Bacteroidales bacterium]
MVGDADCLLFPNIEAGNVFFKTGTKLAGAELAAYVAGARVPCVPYFARRQCPYQDLLNCISRFNG